MQHTGHLVDLHQRRIYPAIVTVEGEHIVHIEAVSSEMVAPGYLLPGFVDAHVHVESSMLPPSEFARLAVVHGTVSTVSDPHEIANVLGQAGVDFMLADAARTPFAFCFGAPSCVPATTFETAGAALDAQAVEALLARPDIGYLSEMMNFPGVLHADAEVMAKIAAAHRLGKPVDGHAPGLRGEAARHYFAQGISTDHECFMLEEALEKAALGVHILIREGSAARNFEALWPVLQRYPDQVMFCSDDKHPDELIQGHINQSVARAIAKGCDLFAVLRAACVHPVQHYRLPVGQLRVGDRADFIRVADLTHFAVQETWIKGQCVANNGQSQLPRLLVQTPNQCVGLPKRADQFAVEAHNAVHNIRVIGVWDGEIITEARTATLAAENGQLHSNLEQDILKIAVVNRYTPDAVPAVSFVQGVGLRRGAIASSVAHDSHNVVAVGTDDASLATVVNAVLAAKGGIVATDGEGIVHTLPLPIAGLMSPEDGYTLAHQYAKIDTFVKEDLGSPLRAPFMTLSFLALPVIPSLKITDLGLFDVEKFGFTSCML